MWWLLLDFVPVVGSEAVEAFGDGHAAWIVGLTR